MRREKLYGSVNPKLNASTNLQRLAMKSSAEMISLKTLKSTGEFNITVNIYEEIASQLKILKSKIKFLYFYKNQ